MGSSQSSTSRWASLVLTVALALGGCGGTENAAPTGEGAQGNVAGEAAAPAASRPVAEPKPAAAGVLTAEGFGPLRIGMSLAEITAALGPDSEPNAVGGADPAQCDQFRPERAPKGMLLMVEQGRLTRISLIRDATIKTDRGLGVGASPAAVRSAYGRELTASPHKYESAPAQYLTVWARGGTAGAEYVKDATARGIVYEVGSKGTVQAIHAGGPSIQYVEGCS